MRRIWSSTLKKASNAVAAFVALTAAVAGAQPAAQTPSQVVDGLAAQVLVVLKDDKLSSDEKRDRIEQIADTAIDFTTLSKLVLARHWSQFSPEQQKEFAAEFRKHLAITYGRNVDSYQNESVVVLSERPESRGDVTVLTKIERGGGNEDIVVDYRLRRKTGDWKIIDVIVEGVSLVSNFRSQFQDILATGGPNRLLTLLREKNAAGQPLQPTPGVEAGAAAGGGADNGARTSC
ncbi:MAG: phospholipid-binding protein MlaC [Candidatus Binatia bacterium]